MLRHAESELKAIRPEYADSPEVVLLRVALLHEKRDWNKLRTFAAKLVKRQPEIVDWWVSLAFATRRAASVEAAQEILLEAEKRHGAEAIVHFNLGCYACVLGDIAGARRRVRKAALLDSQFGQMYKTDPDLEALRKADGVG